MKRTSNRRGGVALLILAGLSLLPNATFAQRQPANRPCRQDEYFVDVPTWASPSWATATGFAGALKANLDLHLQGSWFCTGPGCAPSSELEAVVNTVLTARAPTGQSWRNDGDRRFFRVGFRNRRTRALVVPRAGAECLVVAQLRADATLVAGGTPLYIGRECDGSALGAPLELNPSTEMLQWPAVSMNIPSGQVVGDAPADLVLIDAGVHPPVAQASDVAIYQQQSFGPTGALHPHGTAMALFLRQTAPKARIHDARALGTDGHATSKPLATAIDWALFSVRRPNVPMILNLSLGWHESFSSYAPLSNGSGCSTWEDPFGEPVHYLLVGAAKAGLAAVVAATGNDPSTGATPHAWSRTPPPGAAPVPSCASLNAESRWFYPARWNIQSSCQSDLSSVYAVTGVSGIDSRNRISNLGITFDEAAIVAPGDHVYAKHPSAPARNVTLCDPALEPLTTGPSLPRVFSGSSVASAYAAGALARIQVAPIPQGQGTLKLDQARMLLYLTGRNLCRDSYPGTRPIPREIDIGRLDAALQNPICLGALLECSSGSTQIGPTTLESCRSALATCGLEPGGLPVCKPTQPGVRWPATYTEAPCHPALPEAPPVEVPCGGTVPCDTEFQLDKQQSGSVGPQPEGVGCPECKIICGPTSATLSGQLNKTYAIATTFTQPKLLVDVPTLGSKTIHLYGTGMPASSYWTPGAFVQVKIPLSSFNGSINCANSKGSFVVTITQPSSGPVTDSSSLRIEAPPL